MNQILFNDNWTVTEQTANFGMDNQEAMQTIVLPYDAMINCPRTPDATSGNKKGYYPNKTWAYTKTFSVPEDYRNKHVCFLFEGVYRQAMVYINDDFAGQDVSGYSGFVIEADRFLRYGQENQIKVVARTSDDSRWYTGAGIYRDVYMLVSDLVHITPFGLKVTSESITDAMASVSITTMVQSLSAAAATGVRVHTQLLAPGGSVVAEDSAPVTVLRGDSATLRQRLAVHNPMRWDVDAPNLYTCKTRVLDVTDNVMDESCETFGIRSLSLDVENGLQVNDKPIKLRGACIHHDNGPIGAASFARAEERRIQIMKDAGFNAIRMSHHTAGPALLRACDKLGMLVMDEAFDMWTETKCNFDYAIDFPTWWEKDITAMVDKDYNHPSVIIYSIGNEIQEAGTPAGAAWGRKLAEKIRSLDSTRYTLNSINGMVAGKLLGAMRMKMREGMAAAMSSGKMEINTMMNALGDATKQVMMMDEVTQCTAESFAAVDIAGYNYMDSRYEMDKKLFPNRVICGSETYTPEIASNWQLIKNNSHVIGDFAWTGWEYLGEAALGKVVYSPDPRSTVYGEYPNLLSMTGDIDITGYRRPASFYREIVFGLRKVPYIAVQRPEHYGEPARMTSWSWSDAVSSWSWERYTGKPVKVEVYSDAQEVELLLNGKSVGRAAVGEGEKFKTEFDVVYEPGELIAIAYVNGAETGRYALHSATGEAKLLLEADRTEVSGDSADLVYVKVSIADADGNVYSDMNQKVSLEVTGSAQLAGFGTGDPAPSEAFYDHARTTFDGYALAIIRPTGVGSITITAHVEGLDTATLHVLAK